MLGGSGVFGLEREEVFPAEPERPPGAGLRGVFLAIPASLDKLRTAATTPGPQLKIYRDLPSGSSVGAAAILFRDHLDARGLPPG